VAARRLVRRPPVKALLVRRMLQQNRLRALADANASGSSADTASADTAGSNAAGSDAADAKAADATTRSVADVGAVYTTANNPFTHAVADAGANSGEPNTVAHWIADACAHFG